MKVIKTNQEQMYNLIRKYSVYELPEIDRTEFKKAARAWSYWMNYISPFGNQVITYLEVHMGQAKLRIRCPKDNYDKVFHPQLEDLEGMIDEA